MPRRYRKNWNTSAKQRRASFGRFARGAGTALSLAGQALKVAKGVASIVNAENKFFDTIAVATGVNTTPAINQLTAIPQGDGASERDGNSVKATKFQFRADINWTAYTAGGARVRVILLRDLGSTLSAPTINTILANYGTAQQLMQSFLNLNQNKRYQILYDRVFSQNTEIDNNHIDYRYNFAPLTKQVDNLSKKANPHITWNSTAGTGVVFGHIYAVIIGDQTANLPTISYVSRVRYIDN